MSYRYPSTGLVPIVGAILSLTIQTWTFSPQVLQQSLRGKVGGNSNLNRLFLRAQNSGRIRIRGSGKNICAVKEADLRGESLI